MRERRQRIAAVDMREIHELSARARWVAHVDRTLIKIDGAGVQVGGRSAIGNGEQFEVIESLLHAAAFAVAAIDNAAVADLRPRSSAVLALPNPPVHKPAGGSQ